MTDLKKHLEGQVHFQFYRDGQLWYETDSGFKFPVPIEDCGTAAFNRDDKAMMFMRYIRKFIAVVDAETQKPRG
jgi:hypothetical protein